MAKSLTEHDDRHFLLTIRRLADSLGYGVDASPFVGSGVDFAQSRAYVAGDSTRTIDWRVTARTGKPFMKEYEAHKRLPMYLLLDTSASMWATSVAQSKFDWAVRLAGALALTGLDHLNPVALFGGGSDESKSAEPLRFRPSLSQRQALGWMHRLRAMSSPTSETSHPAGISTAIRDVMVESTDRGVIVILSDLYEPNCVAAIRRAAQRHDVIVLRLRDPAEDGHTGGGIFHAAEAESPSTFVTTGRRELSGGDDVMTELRRASVDAITLRTELPFLPDLRRFLHRRNRVRSSR